jgi:hypothetical protein
VYGNGTARLCTASNTVELEPHEGFHQSCQDRQQEGNKILNRHKNRHKYEKQFVPAGGDDYQEAALHDSYLHDYQETALQYSYQYPTTG